MNEKEKTIKERLMRRLKGDRASVFLEFALIAPLAISLLCFAADFTRILRTEQQLEIAARAAADIQIHLSGTEDGEVPDAKAKTAVKLYLEEHAKVVDSWQHVYLKGKVFTNRNIFTALVNVVNNELLRKNKKDDNIFWTLISGFLKAVAKVLTFGNDVYLLNIPPHDRGIMISCSCAIKTLLPNFCYSYFGQHSYGNYLMVVQSEPKKSSGHQDPSDPNNMASSDAGANLDKNTRYRYYVSMPILDTVPVAFDNLIADIRKWPIIRKFVK